MSCDGRPDEATPIEPVREDRRKGLWRFEHHDAGPLITVLLGAIYLAAIFGRGCASFP